MASPKQAIMPGVEGLQIRVVSKTDLYGESIKGVNTVGISLNGEVWILDPAHARKDLMNKKLTLTREAGWRVLALPLPPARPWVKKTNYYKHHYSTHVKPDIALKRDKELLAIAIVDYAPPLAILTATEQSIVKRREMDRLAPGSSQVRDMELVNFIDEFYESLDVNMLKELSSDEVTESIEGARLQFGQFEIKFGEPAPDEMATKLSEYVRKAEVHRALTQREEMASKAYGKIHKIMDDNKVPVGLPQSKYRQILLFLQMSDESICERIVECGEGLRDSPSCHVGGVGHFYDAAVWIVQKMTCDASLGETFGRYDSIVMLTCDHKVDGVHFDQLTACPQCRRDLTTVATPRWLTSVAMTYYGRQVIEDFQARPSVRRNNLATGTVLKRATFAAWKEAHDIVRAMQEPVANLQNTDENIEPNVPERVALSPK